MTIAYDGCVCEIHKIRVKHVRYSEDCTQSLGRIRSRPQNIKEFRDCRYCCSGMPCFANMYLTLVWCPTLFVLQENSSMSPRSMINLDERMIV
jgi:hypothetical protein